MWRTVRVEAFRCLTECSGSSRVTARPFELVPRESVTVRLRQESRVSSSSVLRGGKSQSCSFVGPGLPGLSRVVARAFGLRVRVVLVLVGAIASKVKGRLLSPRDRGPPGPREDRRRARHGRQQAERQRNTTTSARHHHRCTARGFSVSGHPTYSTGTSYDIAP